MSRCKLALAVLASLGPWAFQTTTSCAEPVVPGSGRKITSVGDNFEKPEWSYEFNGQKSSHDIDGQRRKPYGRATNGRFKEGTGRGQPDVLERVATPAGGLPGSAGSLLMTSLDTGIPGRRTKEVQQDDLHASCSARVGGLIPVSSSPSAVVRVYVPPFEEWEQRDGLSFGFRLSLRGTAPKQTKQELEKFWPGIFIQYHPRGTARSQGPSANLVLRASNRGDTAGPAITPGWWTFGMSCTSDGMVHYYAGEGVEDLTEENFIASYYAHGYRARQFSTFFFNVANQADGRNWTTEWIIDDPALYVVGPLPKELTAQRSTTRRPGNMSDE
ncbi:MAG: hypothetical protein SGJ19_05995 [Planctomycetia bacterium]|nr:hypothetical protein [Planctomycetia bacterium]